MSVDLRIPSPGIRHPKNYFSQIFAFLRFIFSPKYVVFVFTMYVV